CGYREMITQHGGSRIQECRYRTADLTGRKLCISLKSGSRAYPAFLAYIRAVPADPEPSSERNLVATNDGWSWLALDGIDAKRDVWKFFEPLRDSDFGLMLWGTGGADFSSNHRTKKGTLAPAETTHSFGRPYRLHAEHMKWFADG